MDEKPKGWKQFNHLKVDRKKLSKRVKDAEKATQRHANRFIIKRLDNARLVAREVTAWLVLVGVVIAALGVQMLWGQNGYMTSAPRAGGLYVEGALGPIDTLNPLFITTSAEASASRLLFSSLYDYDTSGSLRQDIATAMKNDESGQLYTVSLRDDARWHDGKPVTANDVVYTINLIKNPSTRSPMRRGWTDVSARVVDKSTVEFKLPAALATFPYALTFPILPEHILKGVAPAAMRESAFSQAPVGSGPFSFRRLQAADTINVAKVLHVNANHDYYGGAPKVGRFELRAYPDETSLLRAVNIDEVSGATDISVTAAKDITSSDVRVIPQALNSGVYMLFNMNQPILSDVKVRQALQLATDAPAIRDMLGGGVRRLDGPLLEGQVEGDDVPRAAKTDINRAMTLLDEAGWTTVGSYRVKDNQKLELTITTTERKEYAEVLKKVEEQWRKLGVKVNLNIVDTTTPTANFSQNVLQTRNYDILLYELPIGADPDVFVYWHSSQIGPNGSNLSNYSSRLTDASLISARARQEPELRNAKYKQFIRQWLDDAPAIALYQPVVEYAINKNVTAVQPNSRVVTGADRYANVLHWTVQNSDVYKTP